MTWGHVIACGIGALIVLAIPWILRRLKGKTNTLSGYSSEQAEKERERIIGHAESERDSLKDESDKAKDRINDFFED